MENITKREKEVLNLAILGLNNREISEKLGIKRDTVKAHLSSVYRKLGVQKRIPAILQSIELGIATIPPIE
ncbi:helix-turn-helix transcriptional regulator [bacterium]|nr:helix-turn-helix transcriptional regulator [bacterium]MBP3925443.1 helix-turn-helix transcriptional regulator [bacterium]